jgi:hypothetical protein
MNKTNFQVKGPFSWLSIFDRPIKIVVVVLLVYFVLNVGFWQVYLKIGGAVSLIISASIATWFYRVTEYYLLSRKISKYPLLLIKLLAWFAGIVLFMGMVNIFNYGAKNFSGYPEYVIFPCDYDIDALTFEQQKEIDKFYKYIGYDCDSESGGDVH